VSEFPDVKNYKWQLKPVWHKIGVPIGNSWYQRVNWSGLVHCPQQLFRLSEIQVLRSPQRTADLEHGRVLKCCEAAWSAWSDDRQSRRVSDETRHKWTYWQRSPTSVPDWDETTSCRRVTGGYAWETHCTSHLDQTLYSTNVTLTYCKPLVIHDFICKMQVLLLCDINLVLIVNTKHWSWELSTFVLFNSVILFIT